MKFITTKDSTTGEDIQLSYCDYGKGRPVVLLHGWPYSKETWEYQLGDLVNAGLRVIKYDRRGFGKSSKPWDGYDYDSLAEDLKAILDQLDLRDAVLVGFSMGGGEAVRYVSRYGNDRVSKIVLVSSIIPYLKKTPDNEEGVDGSVFAEMANNIKDDRIGFLDTFGKQFFGVNMLSHPLSDALMNYYAGLAALASQRSTLQAAISFAETDFRQDCANINIPTLIIHGDSDKIVPIDASSNRAAELIKGSKYIIYEGGPHGIFYTHRKQLNQDLIDFCLEQTTQPVSTQATVTDI